MPTAYRRPEGPGEGFPWQDWPPRMRLVVGLVLAVLAGALLRFVRLGAWSLWLDESLTLADSLHGQDVTNPLGYALMGWVYHFGSVRPDEFLLRLPAAVLGALSIPATWWALRPLVGSLAGLGAATIVAASSWHLYWSQNARFYTLALLLSLIGAGLVLRGLHASRARRVLVGLLIFGLTPFVHQSAALLLGAFVGALWIARWAGALEPGLGGRRAWSILAFAVLVGAFAGPGWVFEVLSTWRERQGEGTPLHFVLSTGYALTPTVGLGMLVGAWVALRRLRGPTLVLLVVAVGGPLSALCLSLLLRVSAQYVFVFLPWMAGLAALPLALLDQTAERARIADPGPAPRLRRPYAVAVLYLCLLVLPGLVDSALYMTVRHGDRPRWREAYRHVFDAERRGDLILAMDAPVAEYYLDPRADDLRSWRRVAWLDSYRAQLPGRWSRYPRRTWIVLQRELLADWPAADRTRFLDLLGQEFTLQASFPVPYSPRSLGLEVWLRE